MAEHVEPGGIRSWYDEQGAGEPLVLLLARGQASDRSRVLGLWEWALATVETGGMATVTEGIRALQAAQAGGPRPAEPAAAEVVAVAEAAATCSVAKGSTGPWSSTAC